MSCGNPHEVPWSGVLERVYPYLGGGPDQTGYGTTRPPGNEAVFEHPVERPRFPGLLNVEAGRHSDLAAHGGAHRAAFVYQIASYRSWQQLGREDYQYGQFGEDFTVAGPPMTRSASSGERLVRGG